MVERWRRLDEPKGITVSTRGRVRGRLGTLVPANAGEVAIDGRRWKVSGLVTAAFGAGVGESEELLEMGEVYLVARRAELEAEIARVDQALAFARGVYQIQEGEDITHLATPAAVTPISLAEAAKKEAYQLAAVYRSGITVDPATELTRPEIASRLRRLRSHYGRALETPLRGLDL